MLHAERINLFETTRHVWLTLPSTLAAVAILCGVERHNMVDNFEAGHWIRHNLIVNQFSSVR